MMAWFIEKSIFIIGLSENKAFILEEAKKH